MRDFESKSRSSDVDEKILSKALTFSLVQQALQATKPQQQDLTPLILFMMQQQNKGGSDDFLKFMQVWMHQSAEQARIQQQMQQQLFTLLFGKQQETFKESLGELARRLDDAINQLAIRIELLRNQGAEKEPKLKEYVRELIETKEALEQLRDHLGIGEKEVPVVDEKGKLNTAKLIERGIRLAEKIIEKIPMKAPEPKPVQQIPVPAQPVPAPEPVPEKPPEPSIEEKLKPIEEKLEELERKAEISFNIPEPPEQEINIQTTNIENQENIEYGGVGANEVEEASSEGAGEQEITAEVVETGTEEHKNTGHSSGNTEE